jgi:hypothetical protein
MSDDDEHIRPFAATLAELDKGRVHARLSEQLHALTTAVQATGKVGTLTLTIDLRPITKGNSDTLKLTTKTVLKAPAGDEETPTTVFFTDAAGNLTREDPTQLKLPLRLANDGRATA